MKIIILISLGIIAIGIIKAVAYSLQLFFDGDYISSETKKTFRYKKDSGILLIKLGVIAAITSAFILEVV